jgi:hypothetical protein
MPNAAKAARVCHVPCCDPAPAEQAFRGTIVALFDPLVLFIVGAGVFAGAFVSGLMGFAFSAVAGAVLLHVLPPTEAVPLMKACSIVTQAVSLYALRGTVK